MAADPPPGPSVAAGDTGDASQLTWYDREVLAALRRLANARVQLAVLETQLATQAAVPSTDPRDAGAVERLQVEIDALAHKARSRFGGSSARERVAELRREQATLLDRLGFASYEDFTAAGGLLAPAEQVDPVFVDFARRELASAEAAWQEVLELPEEVPEPAASTGIDGVAIGDVTALPDAHPPIDLTRPEAG
jgi:hypothetical protein